ncbi:MAG: hypothetical protein ACPGJS_05510 [Flammeovirgaceae bacterium]
MTQLNWQTSDSTYIKVSPDGNDLNAGTSNFPVRTLLKGIDLWNGERNPRVELALGEYHGMINFTNSGNLDIIGSPYATIRDDGTALKFIEVGGTDHNTFLKNLEIIDYRIAVNHDRTERDIRFLTIVNTIVRTAQRCLVFFRMTARFESSLFVNVDADLRWLEYCRQSTFYNATLRFRNIGIESIQNSIFANSVIIFEEEVKAIQNCVFSGDTFFGIELDASQILTDPLAEDLEIGQYYYVRSGSITVDGTAHVQYSKFRYISGTVSGAASLVKIYDYTTFKSQFVDNNGAFQAISFQGCVEEAISNTFVNPTAHDYMLKPTSVATNLSANKSFVGKFGIGHSKLAGLNTAGSSLDNMQFDSSRGYLPIDETQVGSATFPIITNTSIHRELKSLNLIGRQSFTTGQKYTSKSDFSSELDTSSLPSTPVALTTGDRIYVQGYDIVDITNGGTTTQIGNGTGYTVVDGDTISSVSGSGKILIERSLPSRLYARIKTSNISAVDCDQQAYQEVPINEQIFMDANGVLNGEDTFDLTTQRPLYWSFMRVQIVYQPNQLVSV